MNAPRAREALAGAADMERSFLHAGARAQNLPRFRQSSARGARKRLHFACGQAAPYSNALGLDHGLSSLYRHAGSDFSISGFIGKRLLTIAARYPWANSRQER